MASFRKLSLLAVHALILILSCASCTGTQFSATGAGTGNGAEAQREHLPENSNLPQIQNDERITENGPIIQSLQVPPTLACDGNPPLLTPGAQTIIKWKVSGFTQQPTFAVKSGGGTIAAIDATRARYTAPFAGPQQLIVITARIGNASADCQARILGQNEIFVADDGISRGLKGNVYQLPQGTQQLPEFSGMTPISTILAPNLDVPERDFTAGFPGVPGLIEWFGIRFDGKITIPSGDNYSFKIVSDDGAKLYVDGVLVVNNDGIHSPIEKIGNAALNQGSHTIRIDYFQGPKVKIALQVYWKSSVDSGYSIIPLSSIDRP